MSIEYATIVPLQAGAAVVASAAWLTLRVRSHRDPNTDAVLRCSMGFFGATCLTSLVFPAAWAWNEFGTIDLGTVLWLALLLVTASVVLFVLFAVAVLLLLVGVARRLSRRVVQS